MSGGEWMLTKGVDYDLTLELRVLHAVLVSQRPENVVVVAQRVPPEDWASADHAQCLRYLLAWVDKGRPLSLESVIMALAQPVDDRRKEWRKGVMMALLEREANRAFAAVSALEHYVEQLRRMADRRRAWKAIRAAEEALTGADLDETPAALTAASAGLVEGFRLRGAPQRAHTYDDWLLQKQEEAANGPARRVTLGLRRLDYMVGANPSDLVVIAARPATGKTAIGLQAVMHNVCLGKPCMVASYEMGFHQLVDRIASGLVGINSRKLRDEPHTLSTEEWERLLRAKDMLDELPLTIMETDGANAEDLSRMVAAAPETQLLMVDYLTIMPAMDRAASRERQVGESCTRLKRLAKEQGLVVHLLAQLNRAGADRPPVPTDLRDSGQIEQDADRILMGWVPDPDSSDRQWLVRKNRHGPTGDAILGFRGSEQRFFDRDDEDVEV